MQILPTNFLSQRSWRPYFLFVIWPPKKGLHVGLFLFISAKAGRSFFKSNNVGHHFFPDFQRFCPDFQGFWSDFRQIKTLPPTPQHKVSILAFLRPIFENLAVFRSDLASNVWRFGLFWIFLKIWLNVCLICMWYHIPESNNQNVSMCTLASTLSFLAVEITSLTFQTKRMEIVNGA